MIPASVLLLSIVASHSCTVCQLLSDEKHSLGAVLKLIKGIALKTEDAQGYADEVIRRGGR